jgi:hypothetical protein
VRTVATRVFRARFLCVFRAFSVRTIATRVFRAFSVRFCRNAAIELIRHRCTDKKILQEDYFFTGLQRTVIYMIF